MNFQPAFPAFKQKVEDSFDRQRFMHHVNAKLVDVQPGYCEIEVPYAPELSQQHGYFHAGIIGTVADNTMGYAAFSLMEETSSIVTVEYKINIVSPGDGDKLIGKASVLKKGRTLTVCRTDVFVVKDGKEKLCAAAQATLIELRDQIDSEKNTVK